MHKVNSYAYINENQEITIVYLLDIEEILNLQSSSACKLSMDQVTTWSGVQNSV